MTPTTTKMAQIIIARKKGSAIRAFTGIWAPGMIPQMLQLRTKTNSDPRNDVYFRPSGPIVSRMMPSWMKP